MTNSVFAGELVNRGPWLLTGQSKIERYQGLFGYRVREIVEEKQTVTLAKDGTQTNIFRWRVATEKDRMPAPTFGQTFF